jgi:paired amphipathic helix protein Sin3a
VLNDEWVSHPTWASEESGFVAHKKNTYEEALHKSEEERHEYQVHLDSLVRTISIFEPLNARVEEMTNDERNSWRLKADFGGPSKWIYHKTIRKIYGRDSGAEVIQALQDCPGVAVPVVLHRLKQKEDDWRRAMREWGRMWKEVDAKNFYKSLDHQGLVFKSNDKKAITAKHFVSDIETVKLEQKERLEAELDGEDEGERDAQRNRNRRARGRRSRRDRQQRKRARGVFKSLGFQLDYSFADTTVLHDCLKLVYSYLDHNPSQYSFQERRSIEKFLQSFIPAFCYLPIMEFSHGFEPMDEDAPLGPPSSDGEGKAARDVSQDSGDKPLSGKKFSTNDEPAPSLPENRQTAKVPPCETWIRESVQSGPGGQEAGKTVISRHPFFANTTFYTLLRLIQVRALIHHIGRTASDAIAP